MKTKKTVQEHIYEEGKALFKRLFSRCFLAVPILLMFFYGTSNTAAKNQHHNTIHIYASNDFPPYEYIDDEGKPNGFNIDMIREIMREMGAKYKITMTSWNDALKAFDENKADIILGMSYSKKRAKKYVFGLNYASLFQAVIYKRGTGPYKDLAGLKGKKVLVDNGDILQDIAHENGLNTEIIPMNNIIEGLHKLSEGKVDAVLCSRDVALFLIIDKDIKNLDINELTLPPLQYGYAGRSPQLINDMDKAFIKVRNNGVQEKLFRKWFYNDSSTKILNIIVFSISAIIICCGIFFVFIHMLRKKVEQARQIIGIQSQRMKLVLHAGGVEVWGYDVKERLFFNVECNFFPNDGLSYEKTISELHPEDRQIFADAINRLSESKALQDGITLRLKINSSRDYRYVQSEFAQTFDEEGNVKNIIGSFRDTTEMMKRNEELHLFTEKMNYVLKSSHTIIWEYNIKTHFITLYDGVNSIVETLHCNDYFNLLNGKDRDEAMKLYHTMDEGEAKPFSNIRQISHSKYSHKKCYALFNGIPLYDNQHHVMSYFGLRRDVTELISIQNKLKEETEKAKIADKLKSAFLANMSHEIRTPLNAIVGFSNLMQTTDVPKDKEEFAKIINTNNELLLNLIDDILCLSKIESGIIEIKNKDFDMAETFNTLVQSLKRRNTNPNVVFLSINPYELCLIKSDSNRIVQLLTNLTTNALKNTHQGHVLMGYKCEEDGITLYVEDTGIGIPEEKKMVIFRRFEKLNDFVQGTGLGLSICKAITDACSGKIWVESEVGKGSTFYAHIPCDVKEQIREESDS